jgi:hypothetical protein
MSICSSKNFLGSLSLAIKEGKKSKAEGWEWRSGGGEGRGEEREEGNRRDTPSCGNRFTPLHERLHLFAC